MANTFAVASVTVKDANGNQVSTPVYLTLNGEHTIDELIFDLASIGNAWDDMMGGVVQSVTVTITTKDIGVKPFPQDGCDIAQTGTFLHPQQGAQYPYGMVIPCLSDQVIVNGRINVLDTKLDAYKYLVENPMIASAIVGREDGHLSAFTSALLSWRKRRRQASKRSYPS